jgi:N,N'-diacetyllegionaminate synthase
MTVIIAEAGENHCGDIGMARQLVELAAVSGCDFVKFQLYDADLAADDDPEKPWFRGVQISAETWSHLVEHARATGIKPLATPWDVVQAERIFEAGLQEVKIASFHVPDLKLLRYVNERARTVFMSVGMCTFDEIDAAVASLSSVQDLYILHCVSEYPLPPENVNLRGMDTLRERYGNRARIGYSDHTTDIVAAVAAVARGAEVVEKHITLGKDLEGTDHILSADPGELPEMVRQIRLVETMLGSSERILTVAEAEHRTFLRERFHH